MSESMKETRVRLDQFNPRLGLQRGRSLWVEAAWYMVKCLFFMTCLPWPSLVKVGWLRLFGARVGCGVVIKPKVNILFPWKLKVGDHVWLGEEVWILNFEEVRIESQVCISQRAFLCGGNHDWQRPDMRYRNGPIHIEAGAWVGAGALVGPGVTIGKEAILTMGAVVIKGVEAGKVVGGNPAVPMRGRWESGELEK
jgi:putative colanic acid biosynthesis acetyltransferase WcaF